MLLCDLGTQRLRERCVRCEYFCRRNLNKGDGCGRLPTTSKCEVAQIALMEVDEFFQNLNFAPF